MVWTGHGADEILCRVTGVGRDTLDEAVRTTLVDDVSAVVGGGLLKDSWVEDRLSKYVGVKGILEVEWLKDAPSKLKGGGRASVGLEAPSGVW